MRKIINLAVLLSAFAINARAEETTKNYDFKNFKTLTMTYDPGDVGGSKMVFSLPQQLKLTREGGVIIKFSDEENARTYQLDETELKEVLYYTRIFFTFDARDGSFPCTGRNVESSAGLPVTNYIWEMQDGSKTALPSGCINKYYQGHLRDFTTQMTIMLLRQF